MKSRQTTVKEEAYGMAFWENIKKDIKKGIDEGIHIMKEGTASMIERAEALAEEGRRKVRSFEIKQKIQVQFAELGGKLYDLLEKKSKAPLSHPSVKSILKKIESLKDELLKIEEKTPPAKKKKKKKKKTAGKKTAKKTAGKKTVKKTTAAQ